MINVQFFASIREAVGTDRQAVNASGIQNIGDLVDRLCQDNPQWEEILKNERVLVALNQEMTNLGARVIDGDEVALFPPVTGG